MKSNVFALAVALSLLVSPASALALLQSPDSVKPQETVESFRIDLRRLYGRLPAGEYSIAIRYPSTSYVVKELAAYEPVDLKSPVLRFKLLSTSLAEATEKSKTPVELQFVLDKPAHGDVATTATITNKTNVPLCFPAYMDFTKRGKPSFKPPLSTLMRNQKWHPKSRWTSRIFGFCGTGLRSYVLEKGASVTVLLNTPLDSDGIYRYELSYSGPDQRNTRTAYSKPFVIRSFKVRLKATATK